MVIMKKYQYSEEELKVIENSFAQNKLGLVPDDDYIIAVKTKSSPIISLNKDEFNPLEILNMVISNNKGNDLIFYIYNKIKGPRTVEVNIDKDDNFVLGCDVAYGALHEFPKVRDEIIEENYEDDAKEVIKKNSIIIQTKKNIADEIDDDFKKIKRRKSKLNVVIDDKMFIDEKDELNHKEENEEKEEKDEKEDKDAIKEEDKEDEKEEKEEKEEE